jgi:hypothetical protein
MIKLNKFLLIFIFSTLLSQCGNVEEITIKEFRMYVFDDDPEVRKEIMSLVHFFNYKACFEAVQIVHDPSHANSTASLVRGMRDQRGRIGEGQYVIQTTEKVSKDPTVGVRRYKVHSMNVWLDEPYFRSRMRSENSMDRYDLEKLVNHEIGHGLEMQHSDDPSDMMFKDTTGTKNEKTYFQRVRAYFDMPETC